MTAQPANLPLKSLIFSENMAKVFKQLLCFPCTGWGYQPDHYLPDSYPGRVEFCDSCGHTRNAYNSCRNRHCPKCQTMAKEDWLNNRKAELLPVPYFHLVLTLPHELNPLILCNMEALLSLLFFSVNEVIKAFAADPQWRLEGNPGFIGVLHTWSQTLLDHFHLHCLVPGGVLANDKSTWTSSKTNFLFKTNSLMLAFKNVYRTFRTTLITISLFYLITFFRFAIVPTHHKDFHTKVFSKNLTSVLAFPI